MDENCNLQLQRIELIQDQHDERIETNKKQIREQSDLLGKVATNISQTRWMVTGAVGFFVLENIGLIEAGKRFLGL